MEHEREPNIFRYLMYALENTPWIIASRVTMYRGETDRCCERTHKTNPVAKERERANESFQDELGKDCPLADRLHEAASGRRASPSLLPDHGSHHRRIQANVSRQPRIGRPLSCLNTRLSTGRDAPGRADTEDASHHRLPHSSSSPAIRECPLVRLSLNYLIRPQ